MRILFAAYRLLPTLESHDVVAAVHVEDFAGDAGGERAEEEERGVADLARLDVAAQRRALCVVAQHDVHVADAARGERVQGAGADGVDAYVPGAEDRKSVV